MCQRGVRSLSKRCQSALLALSCQRARAYLLFFDVPSSALSFTPSGLASRALPLEFCHIQLLAGVGLGDARCVTFFFGKGVGSGASSGLLQAVQARTRRRQRGILFMEAGRDYSEASKDSNRLEILHGINGIGGRFRLRRCATERCGELRVGDSSPDVGWSGFPILS